MARRDHRAARPPRRRPPRARRRLQPRVRDQPRGQRVRAPASRRGEPVTLVTEDGVELTAAGHGGGPRRRCSTRWPALRPSARADLGGPGAHRRHATCSPCSARSAPASVEALLRPAPGGGHAVLLRHRHLGPAPAAAAAPPRRAAALRAGRLARRGGHRRRDRRDRVWDELVGRRRAGRAGGDAAIDRRGHAGRAPAAAPARPPVPQPGRTGPAAAGRPRRPTRRRRRGSRRSRPGWPCCWPARRSPPSCRAAPGSATRASWSSVVVGAGLLLHRLGAAPSSPSASASRCSCCSPSCSPTTRCSGSCRGPPRSAEFGELARRRRRSRSTPASRRCRPPRRSSSWSRPRSGCSRSAVHLAAVQRGRPRRGRRAAARGVRRAGRAGRRSCCRGGRWSARRPGSGCCWWPRRRAAAPARRRRRARRPAPSSLALGRRRRHARSSARRGGSRAAAGGGPAGSIGLSPFTALRGQLDQTAPAELFRGARPAPARLPARAHAAPVRARTGLAGHPPAPGRPAARPGAAIAAACRARSSTSRSTTSAFRDYWLPALRRADRRRRPARRRSGSTTPRSGTGYTARPRQEDGWHAAGAAARPRRCSELRAAQGINGVGLEYLDTDGRRPARRRRSRRRSSATQATDFDRAMALQDYFTGPGSAVPLQPPDRARHAATTRWSSSSPSAAPATASSSPRRWP